MRRTRIGMTSLSTTVRSAFLAGGLTMSLVLAFAANAFALSGTPITIGTPYEVGQLQDAVDASGTAYIAWSDTKDLPPTTTNVVQYCVLPLNATACAYAGTLVPADGGSYVDNVQVLVDESTNPAKIVILADVYGTTGSKATEYTPEQEWQSTDGGATFRLLNEGKSVAEGNIAGDTNPLNAVIVPGTEVLGYGWNAAVSAPTFHAFPLTNPPECSEAPSGCPSGFATLEPNTNPDQIPNLESHFASQPVGANPGVLGIFFTNFTDGPLGCSDAQTVPFGTAYAYASGAQSSTNNYNISPGKPDSAWKVPVTQADCNVEYSTVDGGPSGFGVLEDNELTGQTVYHRFDQSTDSFDTPLVTVADEGELDPAVSQDNSGGVYATFLLGGDGGPISLAYSSDGGSTWTGPATLSSNNTDGGANDVTSSVGPSGQGWATWTDNGSVYAQQFVASDAISAASASPPSSTTTSSPAPTTLTTTQTSGTTTGASISIPAGTVGESDTATITGTNAASASGTVDFALYDNSSCSGTPAFAGAAHAAAGTATIADDSSTGLSPGKYYWRASYAGNATNLPSASTCGSEVLTVTPAATIKGEGESTSTTVALNVSCATFPCTITITLTAPETVVVHAAQATKKKKNKAKTIVLAKGTFTITRPQKLTLHLTKGGRKVFAAHHGRLSASLLLSEKIDGHTILSTKTVKITPAKSKHKK
jgi:hypothetical protein